MTRIHRISGESQGEGKEPLPVLLIEYLWQSKYGLVTLAFATTRLDFMSDEARAIFDRSARWRTSDRSRASPRDR